MQKQQMFMGSNLSFYFDSGFCVVVWKAFLTLSLEKNFKSTSHGLFLKKKKKKFSPHATGHFEILVPWPGIQPTLPPALEAWSLNYWTPKEVPILLLLELIFML